MEAIRGLHGAVAHTGVGPAAGVAVRGHGGHAKATDSQAIAQAADGFESMFMSLLIKEMRQTLEPGTFFGKDGGDVLGGLFDMYMSQHLSQANSLGIGNLVKQQLTTSRT